MSRPKNFGRGRSVPGDTPTGGYYASEKERLEAERRRVRENITELQRRLNYLNTQIEGHRV